MAEQYFMGLDGFIWFVGVVENRNDPAELGRVQVRCLGYHTEDLTFIPTADLPWAHVMHPVTDPSMQGLGNTPSFLVEGSWVVGFFRDARDKQQPIIMGTLPGYPEELPDTKLGFNDPTSTYPAEKRIYSDHGIKESDVSRLARGKDSETHAALKLRRNLRQDKDGKDIEIPIAIKPHIPKVSDNTTLEGRGVWIEPWPKSVTPDDDPYLSAKYPYNHVHESEAGHIHEIDDTPGGERLMQQHSTGTFTEIHPDGSKVVKVVGNNYELIAGNSNVFITGDVNLTVSGDVRELIKKRRDEETGELVGGNYMLEVEGDYTQNIHGEHEVKIGKNRAEQIMGNYASNIQRAIKARVGEDVDYIINGLETRKIGGSYDLAVTKHISIASLNSDILAIANTHIEIGAGTDFSLHAGKILSVLSAKAMNIVTEANGLNITSTGAVIETFSSTLSTTVTSGVSQVFGGTLGTTVTGAVSETFSSGQTTNITGTLDLDATEVDIDAPTINLN